MKKSKKTRKPAAKPQPGSLPGKEEGRPFEEELGNASKFRKPRAVIKKFTCKGDTIEG